MVSAPDGSQTTTEGPSLGVTALCVVTVRADGLQLQTNILAPPFPLGAADLHVLAALSEGTTADPSSIVTAVASGAGADPAELQKLIANLRYSARARIGAAPVHRPAPDHPMFGQHPPVDLDDPRRVVLRLPLVLRLREGRFEVIDADGRRVAALSATEAAALAAMRKAATPRRALGLAQRSGGPDPIADECFAGLLGQLAGADLLRFLESESTLAPDGPADETGLDRDSIIREVFDRHAAAQDESERARVQRTGVIRPKVIPVAFDMGTPAGIGMVVAYAKSFEDGRLDEHYDFRTDWVWSDERLAQFVTAPAIYLFSNYLWSHERCIGVSKRVKKQSPSSITIHGGPDSPKYEADARAYLERNPHVDVIIRGEGEQSAAEVLSALTSVIGDDRPDLAVLANIAGITFRRGDEVVRTPERDRIADVDILPSPFLTGQFDVYTEVPDLFVTVETNRGCPYSCTFCDWGSATASRIRQFDLERVYAELAWCSRMEVGSVSVADANFGIFKRDVEIAQRIAELKNTNGHPRAFGVSFAKNTVKHLQHIITVLADAGIMAQGVLSLQTMDEGTLQSIHRSNIKTERYDQLADEMRHRRLPLMVELMMGLPGQTVDSFADDIQQCIDREVPTRINHTTLLVNSPMNEPDYQAEHQIVTSEGVGPGLNATVISTSSFTTDDYGLMERLRQESLFYENFGAIRLVSRFVRQETGRREIDFYRNLRSEVTGDSDRFPSLAVLASFGPSMMTAPYSWAVAMDELRELLVAVLGVPDSGAVDAILRVQRALLPAYGRSFPETVSLSHDVVAWHNAMLTAKGQGHRTDWTEVTPRLVEYGPGEFRVDDPDHIVDTSLGLNGELSVVGVNWELDSPLSRARIAATQLIDWVTDSIVGTDHDDASQTESLVEVTRR